MVKYVLKYMCKDMNFIKQVMTKESNLDENIVQK